MPIFKGCRLSVNGSACRESSRWKDVLQLVELLSPDLTPALAREVGKNRGFVGAEKEFSGRGNKVVWFIFF